LQFKLAHRQLVQTGLEFISGRSIRYPRGHRARAMEFKSAQTTANLRTLT